MRLVYEQMGAPLPPACQELRSGVEQPKRPAHQIVEVEPARVVERTLIREEGAGHRPGFRVACDLLCRDGNVELQPAERVVELADRAASDARPEVAKHRFAIQQRLHGDATVRQDLPPKRMERLHPHRAGRQPQRLECRIHAQGHLVRGTLVERDRGDRRRIRAGSHEPRDPRHERGGLATPSRRYAQDRARGRRGGFALVGRQAVESFGNAGGEHARQRATEHLATAYVQTRLTEPRGHSGNRLDAGIGCGRHLGHRSTFPTWLPLRLRNRRRRVSGALGVSGPLGICR